MLKILLDLINFFYLIKNLSHSEWKKTVLFLPTPMSISLFIKTLDPNGKKRNEQTSRQKKGNHIIMSENGEKKLKTETIIVIIIVISKEIKFGRK